MAWYTSDRRTRLPSTREWQRIRLQVQQRAHNRCEAQQHSVLCDGYGTDCDHIQQGDNHSLNNLQWLNKHCHKLKTANETKQRNKARSKQRKHPKEKNPGKLF